MRNKLGQVLSSSFVRDAINQRDRGNDRLPGLVDGLQSVSSGEKRIIEVPADHAYGSYKPELVVELDRSELEYGDLLTIGSRVLRRVGGSQEQRVFRVTRLGEDSVTLDANHPLAGHDLVFEVEIVSARDAHAEDFLDSAPHVPGQVLH